MVNTLPNKTLITTAYGLSNSKILQPTLRQPALKFFPWGLDNALSMGRGANSSLSGYIVKGTIGHNTLGFSSDLNFTGKYVSLILGKVIKFSGDLTRGESQISFNFFLKGTHGNYQVVFINGRVNQQGWINNVYYDRVESNSYKLVNFDNLLSQHGDHYLSLHGIALTFEKNQTVDPLEFSIGLYNDTIPSH